MKISTLPDVTPCSLVEVCRLSSRICCTCY